MGQLIEKKADMLTGEYRVYRLGFKPRWELADIESLVGGPVFIHKVKRYNQVYLFAVRQDVKDEPLNGVALFMTGLPLQGNVLVLNPGEELQGLRLSFDSKNNHPKPRPA